MAACPEQAELLEAVLDGPLFTQDELPEVPQEARKAPNPPKALKGKRFWPEHE